MKCRSASIGELPQLKIIYKQAVEHMRQNNLYIWDDIYPGEFLLDDISKNRLYVLTVKEEIVSSFALSDTHAGSACIRWKDTHGKALYIDRLVVNVNYLRKGIGRVALHSAVTLAEEKGAQSVRLFVVDSNKPAINLYIKTGFVKAGGVYTEIIDDKLTFREFGFEIPASHKI